MIFEHGVGPKLAAHHLARDGREGLYAFARFAPDVVVTDIRMPHVSGLEMARTIRSMRADIPIIVSSAFDDSDYLKQAIDLGITRYACKPLDIDELVRGLAECGETVKHRRELLAQRHLSETVLHSLPYPAMLLARADRRIVLANKAAMDLGLLAGGRDEAGFGHAWGEQDLMNLESQAGRQERGPAQFFGHAAFGRVWNVTLAMAGPGLVFVSAADVTRDIELERALRQAEATYRTIFENAVEGIFQTTPDGRILKANAAMARIFGYGSTPEMVEALGGNLEAAYLDPGERRRFIGELQENGAVTGFECQIRKKGGDVAWVSISARAVRDENGAVACLEGLTEDVTEIKRRELELKKRATHDELTGLPNRNFFRTEAEHMLAQAKRTQTPLAMLYIDLDDFKDVNDHFGHQAGDEVLREIAGRLTGRLRKSDFLARIGGDEFFAVLWNMESHDMALAVARGIIEDVHRPCLEKDRACLVGASVGVSLYPDDGDSVEDLVKKADQAMYQAKRLGKNVCQAFAETGG
ncbi:MAG: diguanylate cyclase [Desulfovibrionaceae bacterium]|nr:diguanylate cyclase [Desulfovibrionaceae bacterium]MBF0514576.1 diguanylate cyclase [Desulfovibrionaceae bacterium]